MRHRRRTLIRVLPLALVVSGFSRTVAVQQPIFRSETRLIIETVTVKDKEGRAIEGLTAKDFAITEDGEPQEIAFAEFQRLTPASGAAGSVAFTFAATPASASAANAATADTSADKPVQTQISTAAPGDIRYRDRRLIVMYFDMTAMRGSDQMRAFAAAQKFIATQPNLALISVMAFEGGAVRVKTDFTDDRARLDDVMLRLIYGDDLDGDGFPDNP